MKVTEVCDIILAGRFPKSRTWKTACDHVTDAILATDWPHGSGSFTIVPQSGKKSGEGNGVVPIKLPCIRRLEEHGWKRETLPADQGGVLRTGDLDALYEGADGNVGFEWETGNISSSHRALNKLFLTLLRGSLVGGILVVPSDELKVFLTDRIGNIGELRPYFPLFRAIPVEEGAMRIVVVEHDATSWEVPRIPKGTDGRAKR